MDKDTLAKIEEITDDLLPRRRSFGEAEMMLDRQMAIIQVLILPVIQQNTDAYNRLSDKLEKVGVH